MTASLSELPREDWTRALCAVPEHQLAEVAKGFPDSWTITPKAMPQAGLGLMKMRDSALGDDFYLGEFPMASCWLSISTPAGEHSEGAAIIMDDKLDQAEHIALCDAVLAARLPGWEQVAELIAQGQRQLEKTALERKSLLARTRVDFSLLDDVGDEDA